MKNKNIIESFKNAFCGFYKTFETERNFKIHVVTAICVIIASIIFKLDYYSFAAVTLAIGSVLVAELINTAVEALVDLYCGNKPHPLAKTAKDAAAAAVLAASVFAVIVGAIVFGSRILTYLG